MVLVALRTEVDAMVHDSSAPLDKSVSRVALRVLGLHAALVASRDDPELQRTVLSTAQIDPTPNTSAVVEDQLLSILKRDIRLRQLAEALSRETSMHGNSPDVASAAGMWLPLEWSMSSGWRDTRVDGGFR